MYPQKLPTIDVLLLQTLADGEPQTDKSLSSMWGEEVNRVRDWLSKFRKMGLVDIGSSEKAELVWLGRRAAIESHLAARKAENS